MTFRYKNVKRPDDTIVKTPSIPVTLIGKESFDTIGLLDSGADISAIPREIAEILGIDLDGEPTDAYGIGGKVKSIETTITIAIQKGHESYRFTIPVKVILDPFDFPVLLGRSGFFNQFVVIFDQQQEKVSLKKENIKVAY